MRVKELIAVSGMPGVYKIAGSRNNGIIIEDLDTKKVQFVPSRGHNFSPLETISIYTDVDTIALKEVFQNMLDVMETNPPVALESDEATLRRYFVSILPTYDPKRVHKSDIKKVIKWFNHLHQRGYTTMPEDDVKNETPAE